MTKNELILIIIVITTLIIIRGEPSILDTIIDILQGYIK